MMGYFSFGVTDEMVAPFLEGYSLQGAMEANKVYIINHELLKGLEKTHEQYEVLLFH